MATVLIIEDNPDIRGEIADILELEDFEVVQAPDGKQGLQMAKQHPPTLILCDIMMPELDGYEVLTALRRDARTNMIPLVFLTARADKADIRRGMTLGADDYLTKPFTPEELLQAVNSRLQRQNEIAELVDAQFDAARRRLIELVAYELQAPLDSVKMVQEMIAQRVGAMSQQEVDELLRVLGSNIGHLAHIVEQMIYFSKVETGILSQQWISRQGEVLMFWQLSMAAVQMARRYAAHLEDVSINATERDGDAPIFCELAALKHALAELLVTAMNDSPPDSVVLMAQWQAGAVIHISIVDQGLGIAPTELPTVWDNLREISEEPRGIGVGLPLARRIIQLHGGDVSLNAIPEKGIQVMVRLPVYSED